MIEIASVTPRASAQVQEILGAGIVSELGSGVYSLLPCISGKQLTMELLPQATLQTFSEQQGLRQETATSLEASGGIGLEIYTNLSQHNFSFDLHLSLSTAFDYELGRFACDYRAHRICA